MTTQPSVPKSLPGSTCTLAGPLPQQAMSERSEVDVAAFEALVQGRDGNQSEQPPPINSQTHNGNTDLETESHLAPSTHLSPVQDARKPALGDGGSRAASGPVTAQRESPEVLLANETQRKRLVASQHDLLSGAPCRAEDLLWRPQASHDLKGSDEVAPDGFGSRLPAERAVDASAMHQALPDSPTTADIPFAETRQVGAMPDPLPVVSGDCDALRVPHAPTQQAGEAVGPHALGVTSRTMPPPGFSPSNPSPLGQEAPVVGDEVTMVSAEGDAPPVPQAPIQRAREAAGPHALGVTSQTTLPPGSSPTSPSPLGQEAPIVGDDVTMHGPTGANQSEEPTSGSQSFDTSSGQSDTDQYEASASASNAGEIILNGLHHQAMTRARFETPTAAQLQYYVDQVAQQILVMDPSASADSEIHIVLKDSILPNTEVVVSREEGVLLVRFVARSEDVTQLLTAHQQSMQDQLSHVLDRPVSIEVSAEQQDGRSRGQRDVFAELEEEERS